MLAMINVGMIRTTAENGGYLSASDIHWALSQWEVPLIRSRVAVAKGCEEEDTFIGLVDGWDRDVAMQVATALDQECIAVLDMETSEGELVGPEASKWGKFEPHLFKTL